MQLSGTLSRTKHTACRRSIRSAAVVALYAMACAGVGIVASGFARTSGQMGLIVVISDATFSGSRKAWADITMRRRWRDSKPRPSTM
jgi:hypothetical protein